MILIIVPFENHWETEALLVLPSLFPPSGNLFSLFQGFFNWTFFHLQHLEPFSPTNMMHQRSFRSPFRQFRAGTLTPTHGTIISTPH